MKVTFNLGIGFPTANHKDDFDTEKDLGFTDEEWNELSEGEKSKILMDWAWNYIEVYID